MTRSGTITLKPIFKKIRKKFFKKPRTRKKYRYVNAMSLELAGELLHPSHISALKHMHVRRYSCLALFYFIFSNSDYSIMNHLMLFVCFFSFGSSIHCTMEFNWYVMFFRLAKFHFENILNDNDELIEFISIYYYKRNVLSCCLLIFIIIIIIILLLSLLLLFFLLLVNRESAASSKK